MAYLARTYQISESLLCHVFNQGNGKHDIFHDKGDFNIFIKIIKKYRRAGGSEEFLRKLKKEKGIFVPKNGRPLSKHYK